MTDVFTIHLTGDGRELAARSLERARRAARTGARVFLCVHAADFLASEALGKDRSPGVRRTRLLLGDGLEATLLLGVDARGRDRNAPIDALFCERFAQAAGLRSMLDASTEVHVLSGKPEGNEARGWCRTGEGFFRSLWVRPRERASRLSRGDEVIVVGAGLAGAFSALALSRRGLRPVVLDAGPAPASGASALFAGLYHPHWQASDSPVFQLTRAGCWEMRALLEDFPEMGRACGVFDEAVDDEEWVRWREAAAAGLPFPMPALVGRIVERDEARRLTGFAVRRGGWWYPSSGLVHPARLVRAALERSGARIVPNVCVRLEPLADGSGGWGAFTKGCGDRLLAAAPAAVICAARASESVAGAPEGSYGMSALYGRISLLCEPALEGLVCGLTGDGYLVRTEEGFIGAGATYEPGGALLDASAAHAHNLASFEKLLEGIERPLAAGFYAGERAVTRDRLPSAGALFTARELEGLHFKGRPSSAEIPRAEGLWGLFGLGSRGLSWGWIAAELVAAQMTNEPAPVSAGLVRAMDPARFITARLG